MLSRLQKRCVEISYLAKRCHIGSALDCVDLIDFIYEYKKPNEPFVLGNSHASVALFVVLESRGLVYSAHDMVRAQGMHAKRTVCEVWGANRNEGVVLAHGAKSVAVPEKWAVWVSGGSLGQAEGVAVGMAMADHSRTVWLVTSDGACAEGAVTEALRIAEPLNNLKTYVIFNGWAGCGKTDIHRVRNAVGPAAVIHRAQQEDYPDWLRGLPGHYLVLNEQQYQELMK